MNRKLRQRLLEEHGVRACTLIQFLGDAIVLPAGTLHQVHIYVILILLSSKRLNFGKGIVLCIGKNKRCKVGK